MSVPQTLERPPHDSPQHLRLTVDVPRGLVQVAGELDRSSAHRLVDAVDALRSGPSTVWTLDLRDVTFCDVPGLRALRSAQDRARSCGCGLHLTQVPGFLAYLLDLARR
jgi:anti-anti-sigma factor